MRNLPHVRSEAGRYRESGDTPYPTRPLPARPQIVGDSLLGGVGGGSRLFFFFFNLFLLSLNHPGTLLIEKRANVGDRLFCKCSQECGLRNRSREVEGGEREEKELSPRPHSLLSAAFLVERQVPQGQGAPLPGSVG